MNTAICLKNRSLIRLGGEESAEFLHDLITASVADLPQNTLRPSALLTPQGRILFDLLISRGGDAITLECDADQHGALIKKLRLYRLRRPITIEPDPRPVHAIIEHKGGAFHCLDEAHHHHDPRFDDIGVSRFYGTPPFTASTDTTVWVQLRWRYGIAEGTDELPPEKALPLEARLDLDDGISFDKGCYIGQEVTARTRYRGLIKRSYAPIRSNAPIPAPAQILGVEGRDAGTVLASLPDDEGGWIGLASIRLDYLLSPQTALTVGGIAITPCLPPRLLPLPEKPPKP